MLQNIVHKSPTLYSVMNLFNLISYNELKSCLNWNFDGKHKFFNLEIVHLDGLFSLILFVIFLDSDLNYEDHC